MEDKFGFSESLNESLIDIRRDSLRKPSLLQISTVFSISVLLFLFVGSRFQHIEFYSGILITEFALILLPGIVMLLVYKYDLVRVLRLNGLNISNTFLIVGIMVFALPVVGVFNLVNLLLLKTIFGKVIIHQPPVATDGLSLLINVLVIGASAGICEEVLFRGVIQRGFERFGAVKAILVTALLFGMMHMDFQKLLGTFLLGSLIGFIVYRTNSLYGGTLAHFTNNSIAVLLAYLMNKLSQIVDKSGLSNINKDKAGEFDLSTLTNLPKPQLIAAIIFWLFVLLIFSGAFAGLLAVFIKNTKSSVRNVIREDNKFEIRSIAGLLPGLAFIGLVYIAQGMKLKDISLPVIENIMRFIGLGS